MVIQDPDKKGYYIAGWKKFYNKTQALTYACKYNFQVRWVFNDKVYSDIDWTIPIETSLPELYHQRAQQLRDSYDYIVLHYSGKENSNNVLHSFIDNNIKLDKILIQITDSEHNQAVSYLKKLGDKLRGIELSTLNSSKSNLDFNITNCQLFETGKPLITIYNDNYYCYFSDQLVYPKHTIPTVGNIFSNTIMENFYCTPDIPELTVKQAQEIKKVCELDDNHIIIQNYQNVFKELSSTIENVNNEHNLKYVPLTSKFYKL